jgi:hypothetical protein
MRLMRSDKCMKGQIYVYKYVCDWWDLTNVWKDNFMCIGIYVTDAIGQVYEFTNRYACDLWDLTNASIDKIICIGLYATVVI